MGNSESKPDAVIAIEIGHVNSGFAYSLENTKGHIYTANFGCVLPMDRVPTILLLNEDEKFDSFGIAARDKYMSLSLLKNHGNYRYFNNFEVFPDGQSDYVIYDSSGDTEEATLIYATVIKYLYNLVVTNMPNRAKPKKARLVLTIPDDTGDYMWDIIHDAAKSVDIEEENICIIFNGDAAALYCSKQNLFVNTYSATSKIKTKCILVNLGGRKTAIVTKPFDGNTSKEFQETFTVPCGGESVTELFLNELGSRKDEKEWENFQHRRIYDFESIKLNFEKLKHKFNDTHKLILELPVSFCKLPENKEGERSFDREEFIDDVDNKLVIKKEAMQRLFDPSIEKIVNELKSVQMTVGQGVEVTILLAGGFSESPYVRNIISREMSPSKVLLVPNPNLDVLKGAVMFGHARFRRAKYSYALQFRGPSDNYVFEKLIEKREMLENERVFKKMLTVRQPERNKPIAVTLRKSKKTTTECASPDSRDTARTVKIQPPLDGWQTEVLNCEVSAIVKEKGFHLVLTEQKFQFEGNKYVPY